MKFPDVIVDPARQRVVVTSAGVPELTDISPQVRALGAIRKTLDRVVAATKLASEGFTVDLWQDAYDVMPYELLQNRRKYGYSWVPALLKHDVVTVGPGISFPGDVPYDAEHPPLGAILVPSLGRAVGDPGVTVPPKPPEPPVKVSPIGPLAGGSRFLVNPLAGDETPSGGVVTVDGVRYLKVIVASPFGEVKWWEKQP